MKYYFLGIAGTAMASLAVLLKQKGHDVWGTDSGIYPPMSDFLAANDIKVWQGYDVGHLDTPFDRVVIGNAMSRGNVEVEAVLNRHLPFISLPELIRNEFIQPSRSIVITGTHGKTTTTAMMAWVLDYAGLSPSFLVGGITRNFDSSVQLGTGDYFVIEGDEYDSAFFDKRPKFLHYYPDYLIFNNLEFDHADIYEDLAAIEDGFRKLIRIIPSEGLIVANGDSETVMGVCDPVHSRLQTYGRSEGAAMRYEIVGADADGTRFIVNDGTGTVELMMPFPGEYQVQNAMAVITVARDIGIDWPVLRDALASFRGVKRRMEYWGRFAGADVYDDFAHHPTAIEVTLQAMRQKFPGRRLVALFEPRTNTTVRRFFQDDLAAALQHADAAMITPVFRQERFAADDRLSLDQLQEDLQQENTDVLRPAEYTEIIPMLRDYLREGDLLMLLTNGSLGGEYQKLLAKTVKH